MIHILSFMEAAYYILHENFHHHVPLLLLFLFIHDASTTVLQLIEYAHIVLVGYQSLLRVTKFDVIHQHAFHEFWLSINGFKSNSC